MVTIEFDGRIIVGSFSVDKGLVTTFYGRDSKSTQVGGSLPAVIAKQLLHELAEKAKESRGEHAGTKSQPR